MVRLLDMPLSVAGRVVSASGAEAEAAELIDAYWGSAKRRFAAQRQVMASIRPGVAASQMPAPELLVRERDVTEQTVLTEQRHVYAGRLAWIREAAARLTATAARCGGAAVQRCSGRTFRHLPRHRHRRQRWPGRSVRSRQALARRPGLGGLQGSGRVVIRGADAEILASQCATRRCLFRMEVEDRRCLAVAAVG